MAEDERNRLLSSCHTNDDDDDANVKGISYSHSKLASTDVASSIKDVHINENPQSKTTSLFRRSLSARESHRRVVSQDSDSDEDDIGPPVSSTDSSKLQSSTHAGNNSDDDEIGPPAPATETVRQDDPHEGSDDEIGPPLPDTAVSKSKQEDKDLEEEKTDDDEDDDDDDDSEVVALKRLSFLHTCKW